MVPLFDSTRLSLQFLHPFYFIICVFPVTRDCGSLYTARQGLSWCGLRGLCENKGANNLGPWKLSSRSRCRDDPQSWGGVQSFALEITLKETSEGASKILWKMNLKMSLKYINHYF